MRRFFVTILLAALLLAPFVGVASAKGSGNGGYVPLGQSAGAQYTEDVPTAGGATPAQSVHSHPETDVGSQHTLSELNRSRAGAAAAYLAASLAPQPATAHRQARRHHRAEARRTATTHRRTAGPAAIPAAQTFSGASGFGTWFVVVLVIVLALISGVGIGRVWGGRRNSRG